MTTTEQRIKWLDTAKRIALLAVERSSLLRSLCPRFTHLDEADKSAALRRVAEIGSELDTLADRLMTLEATGAPIGCRAMTLPECGRTIALTLALLVTARLCPEAASEVRTVGDVVSLVGGRDSEKCLEVRGYFRSGGATKW